MYWPAERLTNELSFPDGSNQTSLGKSVSLLTKEFYCVRGTHQVGLKLTRQRQKSHFCVSDGARDVNRKKPGFKSTTQQQLGDGGSVSVKTDFAPTPARNEIQEGEQKNRGEKQKKVWRAGTRTRESGDCLTSKAEGRFFGGRRKLLS